MISAWSSGTGSAGILGALFYAGLVALGMNPRNVLKVVLIIPLIEAATFWFLLRTPSTDDTKTVTSTITIATIESNNCTPSCATCSEEKFSGFKAKFKFLPSLFTYIGPLVVVFIFEYICVSGFVSSVFN